MALISKVEAYINQNKMFEKGQKILVALSGGPDSICLMHILINLKDKYKLQLYAAHVNHMLRGAEAEEDENYVKQFCTKNDVKLFVKRVDINKIVQEKGISTELAGREERYSFFEEIVQSENIDKIAIAHNSNDQAETILMRLIRGSSLEGMVGIRPVRENKFIRPILCLSREEIENYCENNNLCPRIDKTNNETVYKRNKIRLQLLPFLKENFNQDIINTINRFGKIAARDNEYLDKLSEDILKIKYDKKDAYQGILDNGLFQQHEAILTRCIKYVLTDISGVSKNFEQKHIESVIELQKNRTGSSIELPNNIIVVNSYGNIKIINKSIKEVENKDNDREIKEVILENICEQVSEEGINISFNKYSINISMMENKNIDFKNNSLIKYFNCDNINNVIIRYRKDGDKIVPLGMTNSKKLKDIFINEKIPKDEREAIPIIQFDNEIAWVVGVKISDSFKVKGNTKKILQIKLEERN